MAITVDDSVARVTGSDGYAGTTIVVATASFSVSTDDLIVLCVSTISTAAEAITNVTATKSAGTATVGSFTSRVANYGTTTTGEYGGGCILTAPVTAGGTATITTTGTEASGYSDISMSVKAYVVSGQHASPIGNTGTLRNTGGTSDWSPTLLTSSGDGRAFYAAGYYVDPGVTATSSDVESATSSLYESVFSAYKTADHAGVGSVAGNIVSGDTYHLWGVAALEILSAGGGSIVPQAMANYRMRAA
jgi:hypothetical protein